MLHHFVPPKYHAFSKIFIEVIKRFYLNLTTLMYYTTIKLENDFFLQKWRLDSQYTGALEK